MDELVVKDELVRSSQNRNVLDLPPSAMVAQISSMANILNDIIEKQKMYQSFNGKKYVTVDGWCTLGTMLGILPAEREVHEIENGWYAKVDLINKNSGVVVGSASAICTRDEKSWKDRPAYAVRSMAITRSTGKAYRLAFSFIMNMAGYQSTPAEEMPIEEITDQPPHSRPHTTTKAPKQTKAIIFMAENQAYLDKLEKILNEKKVPASQHLDIATILNGKEFNKENVEEAIEKSKTIEIPF